MRLEFRPVKDGGEIAPWVKALQGKSGVYLIREKAGALAPVLDMAEMLYIGESHTDRLYSTVLRHFQHWKGKTAGPTFQASKVDVAVVRCPAARAVDLQDALIAEHRPKKNTAANPDAET